MWREHYCPEDSRRLAAVRHIAVGTDMLGATRCRPKHKSTALQYKHGADVSRHRRHPVPRLGLVDKAVMLRGREQCRPERGVKITAA